MMRLALAALLSLALAAPALADGDKDKKKEPEPPKELENYIRTGEFENCIRTHRIRDTDVLDDYHILFHLRGGKTYLNKLPHRCPRLGFEEAFSYRLSIPELCNVDIITVINRGGGPTLGPSCGLGKFELLEEKPKDEAGAE